MKLYHIENIHICTSIKIIWYIKLKAMKKLYLIQSLLIILFLLQRKQMALGYCDQIALQYPADNTTISLENEFGNGSFSSFTIGFWLYYSLPFINSTNGWTELFRLSSTKGEDCSSDTRRVFFVYNWGISLMRFDFMNCSSGNNGHTWLSLDFNASNVNE